MPGWWTAGPAISIHALLAESDLIIMLYDTSSLIFLSTLSLRRATREPTALRTPHQRFLSTLSLRRATASMRAQQPTQQDFYPRSPCGERLCILHQLQRQLYISIHALLAESDQTQTQQHLISQAISIHALLAESDYPHTRRHDVAHRISIHALLAESDKDTTARQQIADISIHALLAESDGNTG